MMLEVKLLSLLALYWSGCVLRLAHLWKANPMESDL
jgi:hypothetical protein